jgi:hypothetical protein
MLGSLVLFVAIYSIDYPMLFKNCAELYATARAY